MVAPSTRSNEAAEKTMTNSFFFLGLVLFGLNSLKKVNLV
ncbi:unnamed protein product [Brassica napus]|uniref:(rape) hypothetical protein n=1 Tax=Brassica napus TaxID=3708 RepID=A0A816MWH5_BRANA|nr:unnamed protein product [Brassica napus]